MIGDIVSVTFAPVNGITVTAIGKIAARKDIGVDRHMMTDEGGLLFKWRPGQHKRVYKLRLLVSADSNDTLW